MRSKRSKGGWGSKQYLPNGAIFRLVLLLANAQKLVSLDWFQRSCWLIRAIDIEEAGPPIDERLDQPLQHYQRSRQTQNCHCEEYLLCVSVGIVAKTLP